MRELRPWMAGAGALLGVLALLCLNPRFAEQFLRAYIALLPLAGLAAAIGLGAGQMARERASKTLDFLLARPIAPAAIVWIKFLAGTVALALLLAAMTALCYVEPGSPRRDYMLLYRSAVGFPLLCAMLFPRLWCVYAFTLWFSALLDRTAKAAVAGSACLLGMGFLIAFSADYVFPFSSVWAWQLLDNSYNVPLRLLHDPALFRLTGFTLCAVAPLLAFSAAQLFQRSPGRTLGNRTLILSAAAAAGFVILFQNLGLNRLPVLRPVGSMELDSLNGGILAAGEGMATVAVAPDRIEFLDFTDSARPCKAAEARMPLWSTVNLTVAGSQTYILGVRKALPVDERQIAIARLGPDGSVQFAEPIPLGAEDALDFTGSVAIAGHYLYVDTIRQRQCRIEVYDLSPGASRRAPGATLAVDTVRAQPPGTPEREIRKGSMEMSLHGRFLYVTSPSALTAIDLRDPGRPVITSRIAYDNPVPDFPVSRREIASDGRWLVEAAPPLESWNLYDLADPAHPALRGHAPRQGGGVAQSGQSFFEGWRQGVLEFRASSGGLEALRHLSDGRDATYPEVAAAGGYAYTLERVENRWFVSAYRVKR
jgi:hypothetical protein